MTTISIELPEGYQGDEGRFSGLGVYALDFDESKEGVKVCYQSDKTPIAVMRKATDVEILTAFAAHLRTPVKCEIELYIDAAKYGGVGGIVWHKAVGGNKFAPEHFAPVFMRID